MRNGHKFMLGKASTTHQFVSSNNKYVTCNLQLRQKEKINQWL